jgi:hypothetical protein
MGDFLGKVNFYPFPTRRRGDCVAAARGGWELVGSGGGEGKELVGEVHFLLLKK